jgi:hypothetical protein
LLMALEYWKEYNTFRVIGKKYNISHPSCIRNIAWIENELSKDPNFQISNKKELLSNKGTNKTILVIYAIEIPIKRVKKKKKSSIPAKRNNIL